MCLYLCNCFQLSYILCRDFRYSVSTIVRLNRHVPKNVVVVASDHTIICVASATRLVWIGVLYIYIGQDFAAL